MGRRQSQRKAMQPQPTQPSQENNSEKKLQQRRKQKPNTPSTKQMASQQSAQGTSEPKSRPLSPAEDRMELKVRPAAHHCGLREQKHRGLRGSRHTPAFPCHRLPRSSPDPQETASQSPEVGSPGGHEEGDSDTDLSESERLPASPCSRVPPQLQLRPEVIEDKDHSSCTPGARGHTHGRLDFPDFLPPPFNSWSLGQLSVFYNTEGRGAPRPQPVGPLERYLEKMLQLEWRQIQTVQEEGGTPSASDAVSGCHKLPAAATASRLSSPKCILQCQRSFPLTFLSTLASHCALLSGCACTLCRIRYCACSMSPSSCRSVRSLPKRSYSESRVHSAERSAASRAQRLGSPARTNSHLKRMQASGNIRNPLPTARDSSVGDRFGARGGVVSDYRPGRRSGSEQRRGGAERQQGAAEKRRSGSECRRGGAERRRTAEIRDWEIKPDAVTAIMDNLPASKNCPINRANRPKQVEFVT
ncbi:Protein FAM217B [Liparis tanakae]|uniref:Protein FAM217B n=1 Tax=Liparis tanakae TaxID=230148 RepID=A0A4Z2IPD0_9TELE|nr:Protein FAM217B [Liparis tanakae]